MRATSHLPGRHDGTRSPAGTRVAPPSCGGEDEALRSAHRLAAGLSMRLDRAGVASLLDAAGLGALNVPASHGGMALSYESIAHVVRIVAAADRAAATALRHHLVMVAAIAGTGDPLQCGELFALVLRGLRFGRVLAGSGRTALRFVDGDAASIAGRVDPGRAGGADMPPPHLLPVLLRDQQDRPWYALLDAGPFADDAADAPLTVEPGRLLPFWKASAPDTVQPVEAIRLLLLAAAQAGIAGRAVADRIGRLRGGGGDVDPAAIESVGGLRLRLDAAIALLEKAGRAVDRAVVRPTAGSVALAQVAAAGAQILAAALARGAGRIPAGRVVAIGAAAGRRASGRSSRSRRHYAQIGAFYLNGVSPPTRAGR